MSITAAAAAEEIVIDLFERLTTPRPEECLYCYVNRMLEEHGCDCSLRWARHYRDKQAPRATALERRLGYLGGYCDCEIFLNGMTVKTELLTGTDDEDPQPTWPEPFPACPGVRAGSTQPCAVWVRRSRSHYW
jgi:Protein of unknown function (DUF2695)